MALGGSTPNANRIFTITLSHFLLFPISFHFNRQSGIGGIGNKCGGQKHSNDLVDVKKKLRVFYQDEGSAMSIASDDAIRDLTALREHEKYVTAIQSLLFLGNMSATTDEHGQQDLLKQNSCPNIPLWYDGKHVSDFKKDQEVRFDTNTSKRATNGKAYPLLLSNDFNGGCGETITEDLSNALLSTSLVLASVSKSKKWPLLNTNSNVNSSIKRRRSASSLMQCDNKISTSQDGSRVVNIGNKFSDREDKDFPSEKKRKSNADRYRERNFRRKQFFGNKLVRLIDLLKKYKVMISAQVNFSSSLFCF